VTLRWSQTQNTLGGAGELVRPVWRDGAGPWQRVASASVVEEGLGARGLEFTLTFKSENGEAAFIYPYEAADLDAALSANPVWQRHVIGATGGGRVLEALSLGTFPAKRGVFLVTRQHCNENTGPWTLDGFLRAAKPLPDFCAIVVPAVDLDGAIAGNYGKDSFPQDFNRAWSDSCAMRPETLAIRRLQRRWKDAQPLCIDLHAPGGSEAHGPYFFAGKLTAQHAAVLNRFFDTFYAQIPETLRGPRDKYLRVGDYKTRWSKEFSFADNTRSELNWPATSMEIPYQGSGQGADASAVRWFDINDYRKIGETLWNAATAVVQA
jgi:hypothetical protein